MKFRLFFSVLIAILLTSCGHYKDGTSVYADGAWIFLVLGFGGSAYSFYRAYKQSKSGSEIVRNESNYGTPNMPNMPIYKMNSFIIGCVLFVGTIVFIIVQNWNK